MEFIKVEQFKEQPVEVQKVFLDWVNENISNHDLVEDEDCIMLYQDYLKRGYIENDSYPLLTEGQLRKFIEDKTKCKLDIIYYFGDGYDLELCKEHEVGGCFISERCIEYLGTDLLQAYWKVACSVIKEEIERELGYKIDIVG